MGRRLAGLELKAFPNPYYQRSFAMPIKFGNVIPWYVALDSVMP
ncbi:hypothetical protein J2S24_002273 [Thermoanaerobacter pentosaceus]|uniref:Uncharacterized protein n=1 Tax=Thermoanaerobacter pentosaceus TaxID=694059 RepID=A0ABT9M6J7_9THEO|nr:hypothetical protein [Thermoanaerobacter pentosaceus]